MTSEEIVKALRCCQFGEPCDRCPVVRDQNCVNVMHKCAADLIERLTAENAALREKQAKAEAERDALLGKWISVDGTLPAPGMRVLATDVVFVGEAYRTSANTWRRYDGMAMRDCIGSVVTHWMPLPPVPKEAAK